MLRLEELAAAGDLEFFDPLCKIRQRVAFQKALDVFAAKVVLRHPLAAGKTHADDGDHFGILFFDVGSDGFGGTQAAADDLVGMNGIGDALGAGAGGMDHRFAGEIHVLDLSGRVAVVKAVDDHTAALTHQDGVGVLLAVIKGDLHIPHGDDLFGVVQQQLGLNGHGTEHVDDNGGAARLLGTVY